jgi:hypothetical protein
MAGSQKMDTCNAGAEICVHFLGIKFLTVDSGKTMGLILRMTGVFFHPQFWSKFSYHRKSNAEKNYRV